MDQWRGPHVGTDTLLLARRYRDLAEAKDRGDYGDSPQTRSLRVAVEASARINEALGGWADWAKRSAAPQEADR